MRKYTLPTCHPCYLAKSEAEWLEEMYADRYDEQAQVTYSLAQLQTSGLEPKAEQAERRRLVGEATRLAQALGEEPPQGASDPLLDAMDASLARGEKVDMSVLLPKNWSGNRR